ncbi:AEC family transporter [Pseudomonas massiliensis]|uniref:AEC family transporter n=1 Tax=Pseudomonas massiliensis TaxID=522492 RepID=UPI00058DC43E|nr:AEC family transporter [Pseudomonas massiliensis]
MAAVLGITSPIFILIGLGYLLRRFGLVSSEQVRGLGAFVITLALPCLLIQALGQRPIGQVLEPGYLTAYALASLLSFALGWAAFRRGGASRTEAAIAGLGLCVGNTGVIGYPVALMVAGPGAAVALALTMLLENLLLVPLGLALAEAGRGQGGGARRIMEETLARLSHNPLIIGIVLALMLSLTRWSVPPPVARVIQLLAEASVPVALVAIGGVLYGTPVGGHLRQIAGVGLGKLLLHPVLVAAAMWLVGGIEPQLALAGVLLAAAPMMSVYPIVGQRFGLEERCAATLVMTTLGAFLTMSAWLGLARSLP